MYLKLRLSCVKVYNNITKYYHSNGKQNTHTKQLQKVSTCSKHSVDLAFIGFMVMVEWKIREQFYHFSVSALTKNRKINYTTDNGFSYCRSISDLQREMLSTFKI